MVRSDVVARKVARAAAWLDDSEALFSRPAAEASSDVQAHDLASFYLFLAIQECIDLAAHWVADAGWTPPEDPASTFDILADHDAIDRDLAGALRGAAGLRNRIAHGDSTLDPRRVQVEFVQGLPALRRFLAEVARTAASA